MADNRQDREMELQSLIQREVRRIEQRKFEQLPTTPLPEDDNPAASFKDDDK